LGPTGWFEDVQYYSPQTIIWTLKNMTLLARQLRECGQMLSTIWPRTTSCSKEGTSSSGSWSALKYIEKPHRESGERREWQTTEVEPWKRLLAAVGETEKASFRLSIPDKDEVQVLRVLEAEGMAGRKILAVAPDPRCREAWPVEQFAEVGERLLAAYPDLFLATLGGSEDAEIGNQLCSEWGSDLATWRADSQCTVPLPFWSGALPATERAGTMHLGGNSRGAVRGSFSEDFPGKWEPYGDRHIIYARASSAPGACGGVLGEEE
jgi:hypothetical protein